MDRAMNGTGPDRLAVHRQLNIKEGAVRRLLKEHILYKKEAEDNERKLDRLESGHGEEWDIKNAKRIFEESQRMIKDTGDRLEKALQELATLVDSAKSRPELLQDKELLDAETRLTEASSILLAGKAS